MTCYNIVGIDSKQQEAFYFLIVTKEWQAALK